MKYRANIDLIYGADLKPEMFGQILARAGDVTELYPELVKFPERVQLLIDRGFITPIEEVQLDRKGKVQKVEGE